MNFFETFYKSYKMSLTCLDHRMLNTRTRQFIVNLLEVKLWMVRHWCMEYLYSTKIYVYKKMKMIWLQLVRLWIQTTIWTYMKCVKYWCGRILIYTFSFCISYLKIALMTFFVAYHYSAKNINHQILNCILHHIIFISNVSITQRS